MIRRDSKRLIGTVCIFMAACGPPDDVAPVEQAHLTASALDAESTECSKTSTGRNVTESCTHGIVDSEESSEKVLQVAEVLRPAPYFVNGELVGYRIYPGTSPELFDSLGMQFGDLVTEIDGQSLDDPEHVFELFQQLASRQPVQVKVERDGQSKVIELPVE